MKTTTLLLAGFAAGALAAPAVAQDFTPKTAGTFVVTARATGVMTKADDAITTAAGAASGLNVDVRDDVMPTLGFTYFLTDKIAVEAILGTTQHEIRAKGRTTDVEVHKTWVLPPVVTVQYHPMPAAKVSPYVGAGINAMIFYSGKNKNGFDVDLDNGIGWALQAGADVALSGPWSLNLDAKKVFFKTDADINNGALKSDVQLDPWVLSAGVSRRF